ncbi:MAG: DUF58 domain-containing protein, partial [Pseudomonadota bacterium]
MFWGVKVQAADWQGFFSAARFVRAAQSYRVLPPLADARGHVPAPKRRNLLPILGRHPHRRPGTGGDLLDLRDYLPGDPPKMIAWKISARRGRLMTKELESEVPIRATLFIDMAAGTRLGPVGHSALARLVEIAAAVAQANAAARDLTGLCLFDEERVHAWIRPARGPRHLTKIMDLLADVAALPPTASFTPLHRLLPLAYGLAQDLYPDLLDDDINVFPWWLPLWAPQPAYALVRPLTRPNSFMSRAAAWLMRLVRDSPL